MIVAALYSRIKFLYTMSRYVDMSWNTPTTLFRQINSVFSQCITWISFFARVHYVLDTLLSTLPQGHPGIVKIVWISIVFFSILRNNSDSLYYYGGIFSLLRTLFLGNSDSPYLSVGFFNLPNRRPPRLNNFGCSERGIMQSSSWMNIDCRSNRPKHKSFILL